MKCQKDSSFLCNERVVIFRFKRIVRNKYVSDVLPGQCTNYTLKSNKYKRFFLISIICYIDLVIKWWNFHLYRLRNFIKAHFFKRHFPNQFSNLSFSSIWNTCIWYRKKIWRKWNIKLSCLFYQLIMPI